MPEEKSCELREIQIFERGRLVENINCRLEHLKGRDRAVERHKQLRCVARERMIELS